MGYFLRLMIGLVAGTGSAVTLSEDQDYRLLAIIVGSLMAIFIAALLWRMFHLESERNAQRDIVC